MKEIIIPKNEKKELKISVDEDEDFFIILNENSELHLLAVYTSENKDSKINFNVDSKENVCKPIVFFLHGPTSRFPVFDEILWNKDIPDRHIQPG